MKIRPEVQVLVDMGQLPSAMTADSDALEAFDHAVGEVIPPVTVDESLALARLLGPDECFGLGWSLIHLIETAPDWPVTLAQISCEPYWLDLLMQRARNAGAY